ncbi:MAG: VanZ family protein [Lachnospiraceae bacterium]|nr:VanZ family protein [Lachnospiraceae bacterium]
MFAKLYSEFIRLYDVDKLHFFISICIMVSIIVVGVILVRKYAKDKIIVGSLASVYVAFMLHYMLFGRPFQAERTYELELFWTIRTAVETGNLLYYWYVVVNIAVFFIFTLFMCYLTSNSKMSISVALSLSVFIEVNQFIFKLGMFEFDDLINNVIGIVMGCMIFVIAKKVETGISKIK